VLRHEAALHDLPDGVRGFAWGDRLAPGVTALEVGVLCPRETALHIGDALLFADAVIRAARPFQGARRRRRPRRATDGARRAAAERRPHHRSAVRG
jgi:hypothetical protein